MKVVIIEDEKPAAEKLRELIVRTEPSAEVIQLLESVEESINWFSSNKNYDLIFMDIQLDDGISFEIFESVKIDAPVIFTTAYNEYALRAFKVNSIDYLLKPFDEEALNAAFQKFHKLFPGEHDFTARVSRVFEQLSRNYKTRFFVKIGIHFKSIQIDGISCFFVNERCTFLLHKSGKKYDLDYSLDQIQKMVNPDDFFRINRNFLVNINFIDEILSYSTSRLKLKLANCSDENLIVSRDKVSEFKRWMDR